MKIIRRWGATLTTFEALVIGNTIGMTLNVLAIVVNGWALVHGHYLSSVFVATSTAVVCGQLYTLTLARHRIAIWRQELREAKAKRAFAETMMEKMKTATGVAIGMEHDDDTDKMKRH